MLISSWLFLRVHVVHLGLRNYCLQNLLLLAASYDFYFTGDWRFTSFWERPQSSITAAHGLSTPRPGSASVCTMTKFAPFQVRKVRGEGPFLMLPWLNSSRGNAPTARADKSGEAMWKQHREWWERMVALAERTSTPLLFVIHDPTDLTSNGVLQRHLLALADQRGTVHVPQLGSTQWNLDASDPGQV